MDHPESDPEGEAELASLLTSLRPRPDAGWTRATERGLFAGLQRRRRERRAAIGSGAGIALVVVMASLAGAGPLAPEGGAPATADPKCRTVYETRVESVGRVVRRANGQVMVESSKAPVQRAVERCN